jgi:hypothetical protein
MKKINVILSAVLLAASVSFVSASSAQAACSAADPCGTWAMVDGSGNVTNIIVCQPSVCGSGFFAGSKVVLQVPANPVTNTSQGGYYNPDPQNPVKYNEQNNTFSVGAPIAPAPVTRVEVVDSVTLSATINSTTSTFSPNNVVNGSVEFTPVVDTSTSATISATKVTPNSTVKESISFSTPQTVEQIRASLTDELAMLRANLAKLIALLKNWVKN